MGAAAVTAEIARLDAIGRARALSDSESHRLSKLITVERRYKGQGRTRRAKIAGVPPPKRTIDRRIVETVERIAFAGARVRAIYLSPADFVAFHADIGGETFNGHPVRQTRSSKPKSLIYDDHGVSWTVRR